MFDSKSVFELKSICKSLGIETNKNSKKVELLSALEDTGLTEEQIIKEIEKSFGYKEAEKSKPVVEVIKKEEVKSTNKKDILIKMIHPRGALNVGNGVIFTIENPFKLVSKAQADDIIRRAKDEVREATPEETALFYGVEI
jgi:hypothetical protein